MFFFVNTIIEFIKYITISIYIYISAVKFQIISCFRELHFFYKIVSSRELQIFNNIYI